MAHYEDIIYEDNQLKCSLCDDYLLDENCIIEAHIGSPSHRASQVSRTLARQSIVINQDNLHCRVCVKTLDNTNVNEHIQSKHHAKGMEKLKEVVNSDGDFLEFPDKPSQKNGVDLKCILCNDCVLFSMDSVKQHLSNERHRRSRAILVQTLNGIFSVEGSNDDVWCKFCRVYLENYIEVIFEHVDDNAEHRNRLAKILNIIKHQNITIERFLMDPKEDKAHCLKCDKEVSCNIDNLERHVKGKLHTK